MPDYLLFLFAVLSLKAVTYFISKTDYDVFVQRKLIHVIVGFSSCLFLFLFHNWFYLKVLSLLFVFFNFREIWKKRNLAMGRLNSSNLDTVLFPVSYGLLLYFGTNKNLELILISLLILTFSDTFAGIVGYYIGKKKYYIGSYYKTYSGSFAFFISSLIVIFLSFYFFFSIPLSLSFWGAYMISAYLTLIEGISIWGLDNFLVPISAYIIMERFVQAPFDYGFMMTQGIISIGIISYIAYRFRLLSFSGILASAILGIAVFYFGDWRWFLPLLFFFLSGSLFSFLGKEKKNIALALEDISPRTGKQVFSNCGPVFVLLIFYSYTQDSIFLYAYLSLIAAMTADTWASEIGILTDIQPFKITNFQMSVHGVSGAISFLGLSAALVGAGAVGGFLFLWHSASFQILALIILSAWIAQLVDSYLGALLQAKYLCVKCGLYIENSIHCGQKAKKISGFSWLDNNMVNFISSGFAAVFTMFVLNFFPIQ